MQIILEDQETLLLFPLLKVQMVEMLILHMVTHMQVVEVVVLQ